MGDRNRTSISICGGLRLENNGYVVVEKQLRLGPDATCGLNVVSAVSPSGDRSDRGGSPATQEALDEDRL